MTVAEPDKLPYIESVDNSLLPVFGKPEFLDSGFGPAANSATGVLRQADAIKDQIRIETAIYNRLPDQFKEAQAARLDALDLMLRQVLNYARTLRRLQEPQTEQPFCGYELNDRVLVTDTGGIEGTIKAFTPLFEPTHIVVLMDNGVETTVRPERLRPIRES